MNFANLNIGKRLGLGFGLVCTMLVCMIVSSTVMLGRVNNGTHEIVEQPHAADRNDDPAAQRNQRHRHCAAQHAAQ